MSICKRGRGFELRTTEKCSLAEKKSREWRREPRNAGLRVRWSLVHTASSLVVTSCGSSPLNRGVGCEGSSLKKFALVWFQNKGRGQLTTVFGEAKIA